MIYRTAATFIVLFWLTMTALLVHQELRPGDSAFREVPVSHVVKLLFMHRQDRPSPLNIYSDKLRLGQLLLDPEIDDQSQARILKFSGDLNILVPGAKRQRIGWVGELDMDKLLNTHRFQVAVNTHTPTELTSELTVWPEKNLARYELRSEIGTVERQDYTLDERGARTALEQLGVDPSLLPNPSKQRATAPPTIKARLSSLPVHGGQMDTYLVTVEGNGQTLIECHVDQLGRIVHVNTLLGYILAPDDITP